MNVLVVTNPFGGRATGESVTDAAEIAEILSGEHARDVVASEHPDAPKAATKKED
jgi:hypothetical protein